MIIIEINILNAFLNLIYNNLLYEKQIYRGKLDYSHYALLYDVVNVHIHEE